MVAGAAAATAALVHGCTSDSGTTTSSPAAGAGGGDAPEVTKAKLGFIALTDSAPLIIAKEKGLFEKYGMKDVTVVKQASWPVTRDNLVLGSAGGGCRSA
jgi:nitrate/nitrite transport system substrate-binding protein